MVSFIGDNEMMYRANICLRTALRILKPIKTFSAADTDEVYKIIKSIDWDEYIDKKQTFSIDSVVFSDQFRHSKFVTYRAKDAIADYFFDKYGERPSVRLTNADLSLNLHIAGLTCTLSLDSSGESLHKRGYRVEQTEAPLNEVLAAGMILKTGWNGEKNFVDPMCGSGTLLIEAALIATNTPPGIYRQGFAFEKWKDYDEELFDKIYNDDSNEKEFDRKIYGSDISPRAISIAEENIKSAGMSRYVTLSTKPFQQYTEPPKDAILVMNPPYGERISSKDILNLYEMIGTTLKHVFKGYEAWILSYKEECFDKIGLKPSEKIELMNGGLDCEFRKYEIFAGKLKDFKSEGGEFSKSEKFELDEDEDFKTKRELRKDRFLNIKNGGRRSDRKAREGGKSFDKPRRENSFRKSSFDGERDFSDRGERKPWQRDGERKPWQRDGERKPYQRDGERKPYQRDGERKPFQRDGERKPWQRDGERKPYQRDGERKPWQKDGEGGSRFGGSRREGTESGNFVRNAEGKLELRSNGESKPRGERTFNPNRPLFVKGADGKSTVINPKSQDESKNED